jgi:hypothetical protein
MAPQRGRPARGLPRPEAVGGTADAQAGDAVGGTAEARAPRDAVGGTAETPRDAVGGTAP